MAKYYFECQYCGKSWKEHYYIPPKTLKCSVCQDKNIKIRTEDEVNTNVFDYEEDRKER